MLWRPALQGIVTLPAKVAKACHPPTLPFPSCGEVVWLRARRSNRCSPHRLVTPTKPLRRLFFARARQLPTRRSWGMIGAVIGRLPSSVSITRLTPVFPIGSPIGPSRTKVVPMFRVRLASLTTAAALGLLCGCAGMNCNQSLLGRLCGRQRTTEACVIDAGGCCDPCGGACGMGMGDMGMVGEGPVLMDRGPMVMPPAPAPSVPLVPDSSLPLTPTPRLVPQPQGPAQSQPIPYTP